MSEQPVIGKEIADKLNAHDLMTHPTPPPTCPECGASYDCRDTDAVFKDCDNWKCGSWKVVDSGCFHQSKQCQEDSLVIRISSLTRQLAERDEELMMVKADNAAILNLLTDFIETPTMSLMKRIREAKSADHLGQPLLEKLSRLERVADAARKVVKYPWRSCWEEIEGDVLELRKELAALESKVEKSQS